MAGALLTEEELKAIELCVCKRCNYCERKKLAKECKNCSIATKICIRCRETLK